MNEVKERVTEFGHRWFEEWTWLISKTPGVREIVELHTAHGEFDYRDTARWHVEL